GVTQQLDVPVGGTRDPSELVTPKVCHRTVIGGQHRLVRATCLDFHTLRSVGLTTAVEQVLGDLEPGLQGFRRKGQVTVLVVEVLTVLTSKDLKACLVVAHALNKIGRASCRERV